MIRYTFDKCCIEFKKLAENYLHKNYETTKYKFLFFTSHREDKVIASELSDIIAKITFSMYFPLLSPLTKIDFLRNCVVLHKKILTTIIKDRKNNAFMEFYTYYSLLMKHTLYALCGSYFRNYEMINLNYMDYYLDCLECGFDCLKNNEILKEIILSTLRPHMGFKPIGMDNNIIKCVYDTIYQDEKSINLYAKNSDESFVNILKFINTFRLLLIENKDKIILPEITKIMESALEITQTNIRLNRRACPYSIEDNDTTSKKLNMWDNKIIGSITVQEIDDNSIKNNKKNIKLVRQDKSYDSTSATYGIVNEKLFIAY